jgi:two-component system nitrogen regulation sensor histidine kinase NtrY
MALRDVAPELADVFERARNSRRHEYREQLTLWRNGSERTLNVQVTLEREEAHPGAGDQDFVVTIDDITDLVAAQRSTAWSDVARRIAHEIKNPLTPIQLSAERIRRRYGKYITEDREIFDQCTDTIIRQVGDIGRMVDEFSSFARMPKPVMEPTNLAETLQEAVFLQKVGSPEIEFVTRLGDEPLYGYFDTRLMSQVFINILKNATEAIDSKENTSNQPGRIEVRASRQGNQYVIDVIDNGKGLPKENRQRLLEPYMTTREKGTGLGLAIVRKVLEDHGGSIELLDAPQVAEGGHGAMMRLFLPADDTAASSARGTRDKAAAGESAAAKA